MNLVFHISEDGSEIHSMFMRLSSLLLSCDITVMLNITYLLDHLECSLCWYDKSDSYGL